MEKKVCFEIIKDLEVIKKEKKNKLLLNGLLDIWDFQEMALEENGKFNAIIY